MAKHARWSPSKLAAVEACPCFESDNDMRKNSELEASNEGTLLHEAAEHEDPTLLETDEQIWAYESALGYIDKIKKAYKGRKLDRRELKVTVRGLTWGTADRLIAVVSEKILHVFDYKFGRVPVAHAEDNLQLHAYGAGALERFPSYNVVHVHIVAPRIPDYTHAVFTRDELLGGVRDRINNIILSAADPFKEPRGGDHCAFCTNKHRCPVMNTAAEDVVRGAGFLPVPQHFLAETMHSMDDRAKALLLARLLPDWCTLVKRVCTQAALEHGETPVGFGLRRRAGSVSIKDAMTVLQQTVEGFGVTHEDLLVSGVATMTISRLASLLMDRETVPEFETKRDYVDMLEEKFGDAVSRSEDIVYLQKERKMTDAELLETLSTKPNEATKLIEAT